MRRLSGGGAGDVEGVCVRYVDAEGDVATNHDTPLVATTRVLATLNRADGANQTSRFPIFEFRVSCLSLTQTRVFEFVLGCDRHSLASSGNRSLCCEFAQLPSSAVTSRAQPTFHHLHRHPRSVSELEGER